MFQRMLCPLNSPGSLWEWGTTNTCSGSLSHSSGSKVMSKPCFHTPPSGLSNLRMEYTSSIWNEMQTRYLLTRHKENKYATAAAISQWELWLSISSKRKTSGIGSSLERQLDHGCLRQTGNPGAWQRGKWDGHRRVAPRNHWHFWMAGGHWETQLLCLWAPSQSPLYGWWFGGFPPGAAPAALSGSAELRFGSRTHTEIINHTHSCATS